MKEGKRQAAVVSQIGIKILIRSCEGFFLFLFLHCNVSLNRVATFFIFFNFKSGCLSVQLGVKLTQYSWC